MVGTPVIAAINSATVILLNVILLEGPATDTREPAKSLECFSQTYLF